MADPRSTSMTEGVNQHKTNNGLPTLKTLILTAFEATNLKYNNNVIVLAIGQNFMIWGGFCIMQYASLLNGRTRWCQPLSDAAPCNPVSNLDHQALKTIDIMTLLKLVLLYASKTDWCL